MTLDGFIYLWYDSHMRMFYLGSHSGKTTDKYICSSKNMLKQYRLRPQHFKRRILEYCNHSTLLEREQHWLNLIKSNELFYGSRKKYYNVKRFAAGGDTTKYHPDRVNIIKKRYGSKHSESIKNAINRRTPEQKQIHTQRRVESMKKTFNSIGYKFYQEREVRVFVNGVMYKSYRNITLLATDLKLDRSTISRHIAYGTWVVKQRRKHPFLVGDVITFE